MSVRVIVEFQAKSGQREELLGLFERMTTDGPPMPGSLGATFYRAVDDPNVVVEIADWESARARETVFEEFEAAGALAPMFELLAGPPRTTLVEPLH